MLIIETLQGLLQVKEIDCEYEIGLGNEHSMRWLSIDQTKQLIEFLTKQIEGK